MTKKYGDMSLPIRGYKPILEDALRELKMLADAEGDDHSVGICTCSLLSLIAEIKAKLKKERRYIA